MERAQQSPGSQQPDLTVLIPALDEQDGIAAAIAAVADELSRLAVCYEIVVVDDGSQDNTATIVQQLAVTNPCIRLVRHPFNMGIGSAIKTGIQAARGEFMIFIPADLGMNLEQLGLYIEAAQQADIVLGNRSDHCDYTVLRKIVSYANIWLLKLLFKLEQHQFAYINLYRVSVLRKIRIESHGVFISHELIIKARDAGAVIREVTVEYVPRQTGQARGARPSRVIEATLETLIFWLKWISRTVTGQHSNGYVSVRASDDLAQSDLLRKAGGNQV